MHSVFGHIKSGSPLLEIWMSLASGPHWSAAIFSCCCILVGSLSLVEAIQDSKRQINKMSSDGLIWKRLAADPKLVLIVHGFISVGLHLTVSTLNLIFILAFVHLGLDSILGVAVTFRRYCSYSSARQLSQPNNKTSLSGGGGRKGRQNGGYDVLADGQSSSQPSQQIRAEDSESDETDIDAAVDDYKTQMYVSTVMHWNGSEVVNNQESPEVDASRVSSRVSCLLLAVSIIILVTSLAMRWIISDPNWFSMSITMCSFVVYNVILFVIWTHPQRLTSSNPTLKVPCVPWIPVGSTLFHCIMLFQLPALSWIVSSLWLLTGTTYKIIGLNSVVNMLPLSRSGMAVYFGYGYGHSRLNFKLQDSNFSQQSGGIGGNVKTGDMPIARSRNPAHKLRILPEAVMNLNVTSSSIAVYPQPYYKI